jgi:mRNA-degrading endonuclease RelE of RelBE toxin-antitoxin system
MSKVKVHQKAAKYLQRLPKDSKARIKGVLEGLEVNPLGRPHVKHMVGEWAGS